MLDRKHGTGHCCRGHISSCQLVMIGYLTHLSSTHRLAAGRSRETSTQEPYSYWKRYTNRYNAPPLAAGHNGRIIYRCC